MQPDPELEALLAAADRHIDDDGFSARVMQALPARRRYRPWVLLGAALLGCAVAFLPGAELVADVMTALVDYRPGAPLPLVPLAVVILLASGITTVALSET